MLQRYLGWKGIVPASFFCGLLALYWDSTFMHTFYIPPWSSQVMGVYAKDSTSAGLARRLGGGTALKTRVREQKSPVSASCHKLLQRLYNRIGSNLAMMHCSGYFTPSTRRSWVYAVYLSTVNCKSCLTETAPADHNRTPKTEHFPLLQPAFFHRIVNVFLNLNPYLNCSSLSYSSFLSLCVFYGPAWMKSVGDLRSVII